MPEPEAATLCSILNKYLYFILPCPNRGISSSLHKSSKKVMLGKYSREILTFKPFTAVTKLLLLKLVLFKKTVKTNFI